MTNPTKLMETTWMRENVKMKQKKVKISFSHQNKDVRGLDLAGGNPINEN